MPTPLIYNGILYVLANNGTFDAYNLKTGDRALSAAPARGGQRLQCVTSRFGWQDLFVE